MKRFTETQKWSDPWYRRLSIHAKLLWLYLTDQCDCTGLIDLDLEAASFFIGATITEKHLSELMDRVERTVEGKIFIPRFIPFQYGLLSVTCPAHKPVLKLVTERNLSINGKGYQYPNATLTIGYAYPTGKGKEKDKEKEEGVQGEIKSRAVTAIQIYEAYPRKEGRDDALKSIVRRIKEGKSPEFLLQRVKTYARATAWKERRYIPHPATWFNEGRYDDDESCWHDPSKPRPKPQREPMF